jgi:nicotinate dehydrogenase subunit B
VAGGRFDLKLDKDAPLKDPGQYRIVNQSLPRPDLPDKMTGRHTYMQDFRLPGMVHARIVRPRAIGATLTAVDETSIAGIAGARRCRDRPRRNRA